MKLNEENVTASGLITHVYYLVYLFVLKKNIYRMAAVLIGTPVVRV